ncbi:ABC transporter substrate-binding protein [Paenibacillus eucommiae]|uniref:Iron complex transport system substrate-binding protein n=1 Tax=Paenibacillus eucommiae TaxID=1355755 RepID=A0ABS4J4V7_9BACL|nr:ABC transporter substrate-binding protein [Paenibacillus eucommiae]MBP1994867.1 iron complex transport system substrate-binding protein [Paenibacillus eucommiae]
MKNRIKVFAAVTALLCFILLLGACSGATNSNNNAQGDDSAQGSQTEEQQEAGKNEEKAETKPFPRTVKTANGEVTIKEEPKKIAVVHWGYADSILLFNLKSIALALPFTEKQSVLGTESYKPYVKKLEELVVVGENTKVNLEALLTYDPDLIIAGNKINVDISEELSRIAPTVFINEDEANVWGDWPSVVTKFGEILGQEAAAESYIAEFRKQTQTAKEKLAKLDGTVAFVQVREKAVWLQGADYLKQYYEGLGLKAPASDLAKEGAEITLEGLSALDPDHLFLGYFNYSDKSLPALTDEWDDSAVWGKLKSVQNNHVYPINGELALGYGPIGNSYGVQAILDALE